MLSSLKNHPFAVKAFFESSMVLTFAVPKNDILTMIPPCLQLDTFNDEWAFIAMAMVQTKDLRPKGFSKILGNDFFLIGYRVFVRYTNSAGKKLRGLHILKSETDKKKMEWLGNIFTKYQYTTTDILVQKDKTSTITMRSEKSKLSIQILSGEKDVMLPAGSPFVNWKEARKFAGPLPFTFSFDAVKNEVLIIEGVRTTWQPTPIKIISYDIAFLKSLQLKKILLANAFELKNVPYYWKKGIIEKWKG